jgi:hypothetical protein
MPYKFWLNTTSYDDQKSIFAPSAYLCAQSAKFYDNRIAGYIFVYPNAVRGTMVGFGDMANPKKLAAFMDPILLKMKAMPGVDPKSLTKVAISEMGDLADAVGGLLSLMAPPVRAERRSAEIRRRHNPNEKMTIGIGILTMDSRLLGRKDVESPKLADALEKAIPKKLEDGQLRIHLLTGGNVHKLGLNDTSVNPAFRKTYLHVVATGVGGPANVQSLRDLAPDMGSYPNEVRS